MKRTRERQTIDGKEFIVLHKDDSLKGIDLENLPDGISISKIMDVYNSTINYVKTWMLFELELTLLTIPHETGFTWLVENNKRNVCNYTAWERKLKRLTKRLTAFVNYQIGACKEYKRPDKEIRYAK